MASRLREDIKHFYECFCEVVPKRDDKDAWVIQKFPESFADEEVLKSIVNFAYPCEFENVAVQHYSFVLTNIDSKWTFGFCRHDPKTETAIVVLSYLPWHDVFYKFLNELAKILSMPSNAKAKSHDQDLWEFLTASYNMPLPQPGFSFPILDSKGKTVFSGQSPDRFQLPKIGRNINITEYYNAVNGHNMIVVFASMLNERRIIITSKRLYRLSACVQSANDLIYPMIWQHIFIPVLPMSLKDYLLAPMPFLIGVPDDVFKNVSKRDIGDVVILNADTDEVETPFDDLETFPQEIVNFIKKHFRNPSELIDDGISRIFLRALVQLIGGYRDALKFHTGEKITFNADAFIESRSVSMQPFLKKMLQLQIFQQFIDERLQMLNDGLGFSDEFEIEACNYPGKSSSKIKQQYKEFVKSVKDKNFLNPAVKSAVKSVKESGKGVRSAYKGLRSKLRDNPGPAEFDRYSVAATYQNYTANAKPKSAPSSPTSKRKTIVKTSYTKAQQLKQGVDGTNPAYSPLSSSATSSKINSPDLVDLEQINSYAKNLQSDMNLLKEMQDILNSRRLYDGGVQEADLLGAINGGDTPSVDRSLKPVRSLENFQKCTLTSAEVNETEIEEQVKPSRPGSSATVSNWWNTSEYESLHSRVSNNPSPSHQSTTMSSSPTFPASNRKKTWYTSAATTSAASTTASKQQLLSQQKLSLNHIIGKSASYNILDSHDDGVFDDGVFENDRDDIFGASAVHSQNYGGPMVIGNGKSHNGDALFLVTSASSVDVVKLPTSQTSSKINAKMDKTSSDLIRLDSTPSSASDNGLNDFDPLSCHDNGNDESQRGLINPLYTFYKADSQTRYSSPSTLNSSEQNLLQDYGIDFKKFSVSAASSSFDPFIPFESLPKKAVQTKTQWTKFE